VNGAIADSDQAIELVTRILKSLSRRKFYGKVIVPFEAGKLKRLIQEESIDLQPEEEGSSVSPSK
jgi:hypothetical protein